ncbi:carboxylesterase/lipase family protein [Mycolicibacter sinensis]|nr:carboxylesterase family protein [Mycolicibacter sinensis]
MSDPIVATESGAVRGHRVGGIHCFLAVPYAAPPLGAGRFAPPVAHPPWAGVRDATRHGPTAPQPRRDGFGALDMSPYFGPGWIRGHDYLTLNIWSPPTVDSSPVMVFVHGGGFVAGSNRAALYDGAAFARDGVVMVTVNYRLGIAGFLDLLDAPRNRGLLDVLAALAWVRDNIAAFGGDPANVTLFGQSAGATIVGAALATPEADGLIRRAITQSGSGLRAFSGEQAERVALAAATALDVAPTAADFGAVADDDLIAVMPALTGLDLATVDRMDPLAGLSPLGVVSDRRPAEHRLAPVDLLVGTNTEEANLYLAPQGALTSSTDREVRDTAALVHPDPDALVASYRAALPGVALGQLRSTILADALFRIGSRELAEVHGNAYGYEFAWQSKALEGRLGAAHAVELPFVFDRLDLPELRGCRGLLGAGEPPKSLAAEIRACWVSFARSGNPGWPPLGRSQRVHRFAAR